MNIVGGIKDVYSRLDLIRIFQIELKMNIVDGIKGEYILGGNNDEYSRWD